MTYYKNEFAVDDIVVFSEASKNTGIKTFDDIVSNGMFRVIKVEEIPFILRKIAGAKQFVTITDDNGFVDTYSGWWLERVID